MATRARVIPLRRPPAATAADPQLSPAEPLWREALGEHLRELRLDQGETLAETAARAGLSPQYLSEIERGRKEPSSELLAAICEALDVSLPDVLAEAAEVIARSLAADGAEVLMPTRRPIGLRHMDLRLAEAAPVSSPAALPIAPMPVRGVRAAA